jgi:hypothetical protein
MPKGKRRTQDPLLVQVALKIRGPKGLRFSKGVLQQAVRTWAEGRPLPPAIEIQGVFWRNPNRNGQLGYWRWHEGADLSKAPRPLESAPRGDLEAARTSLLEGRLPLENIIFS